MGDSGDSESWPTRFTRGTCIFGGAPANHCLPGRRLGGKLWVKTDWISKWDQYIHGYSTTMYHQNQEMVHLKKGTNFRKTHTLQVLIFFIEGHCCSMLPLVPTNRPGNLPLYNAIGDPVGQWWSEFFRKQKLMGWVGLQRTLQVLGRVFQDDEGKKGDVYFDVCWFW